MDILWYFVPYQDDVQSALDALRAREFAAGRYNPVLRHIRFSEEVLFTQEPGPQHASIEEAVEASGETGTRSILDALRIGDRGDFSAVAPLDDEELLALYETTQPTHEMVRELAVLDIVDRGQCVYLTVYKDGVPNELFFAGYSYD